MNTLFIGKINLIIMCYDCIKLFLLVYKITNDLPITNS